MRKFLEIFNRSRREFSINNEATCSESFDLSWFLERSSEVNPERYLNVNWPSRSILLSDKSRIFKFSCRSVKVPWVSICLRRFRRTYSFSSPFRLSNIPNDKAVKRLPSKILKDSVNNPKRHNLNIFAKHENTNNSKSWYY